MTLLMDNTEATEDGFEQIDFNPSLISECTRAEYNTDTEIAPLLLSPTSSQLSLNMTEYLLLGLIY